jgi:hypothetical protein
MAGQTPKLDSMRKDAELAAVKVKSGTASKDERYKSVDASVRYMFEKRQYEKGLKTKANGTASGPKKDAKDKKRAAYKR